VSNITSNITEFKNDNLSVKVERLPGCHVKMDIFVSPTSSKAAYVQAIKTVGKEVSLPGFRKGRAPNEFVIKNFGKHIDKEWHEVLLQTAFQEAINLTKIYPYSKESIKRPQVKKASKEEGSTISIEFESAPEIPSVKPGDIIVKNVERSQITDKDVEEQIERIRMHYADWQDVAERGIEEGDYVDLDIDSLDQPDLQLCADTRFIVKQGEMGNWMHKLLIGKKPNETVEGVSEKEEHQCTDECHEHGHHDPEFKPTHCRILIKAIKKPNLPEINEDLAKKVGVPTVEVLRERIAKELNQKADERVQETLRSQVKEQLLDKYSFDLPNSLVEHEKQFRVQNKAKELAQSKASEEDLKKAVHKIQDETDQKLYNDYRLFFLARKIAEENNIHIQENELLQEVMRHVWMNKVSYDNLIDESMDPNEVRSKVYVNMLTQKALNFIVENAGEKA